MTYTYQAIYLLPSSLPTPTHTHTRPYAHPSLDTDTEFPSHPRPHLVNSADNVSSGYHAHFYIYSCAQDSRSFPHVSWDFEPFEGISESREEACLVTDIRSVQS